MQQNSGFRIYDVKCTQEINPDELLELIVLNKPGEVTITSPKDARAVLFYVFGGGGGGGGGNTNVNDVYSGGGGGGGSGQMKNQFFSLNPSIQQEYTITIGAGGAGGDVGSDGQDGGFTSIKVEDTNILFAKGGSKGLAPTKGDLTEGTAKGGDGGEGGFGGGGGGGGDGGILDGKTYGPGGSISNSTNISPTGSGYPPGLPGGTAQENAGGGGGNGYPWNQQNGKAGNGKFGGGGGGGGSIAVLDQDPFGQGGDGGSGGSGAAAEKGGDGGPGAVLIEWYGFLQGNAISVTTNSDSLP